MDTVITCPLGSECEKIVGDHIERCAWYVEIIGVHPQTGDKVNESKCAMAWQPILMVENTKTSFQTGATVASLRNETSKRLDAQLIAMVRGDNVKTISSDN